MIKLDPATRAATLRSIAAELEKEARKIKLFEITKELICTCRACQLERASQLLRSKARAITAKARKGPRNV